MLTCSFSIHFNADHTKVSCSDAHTGSLIATFGFGLSHLFDGVDAHHSYSVAWHYTVTQVPGRWKSWIRNTADKKKHHMTTWGCRCVPPPVAVELHVSWHLSVRNGIRSFLQTLSLEIHTHTPVRNDEIRIHRTLDTARLLTAGQKETGNWHKNMPILCI